ncbi:MAG: hypothetical protein Fur0022_21770 [Anaerolineales bacterium]
MAKNEFNWLDIIKGIALVGGAVGLGYLTVKGVEEAVDNLLASDVETATSILVQDVPKMADEMWGLFSMNLSNKAQYNQHARNIYNIAAYIRKSIGQINEIVQNYSVQDAVIMMNGMLANRNDFEQAIFAGLLYNLSQTNLKADAIVGYMKQLPSGR